ncbi:CHASE2 domain-containing protein [filamentous cyanobacterium LEGE 11480]|uniref:CHASE2 domain-containing protein n=2 Tax=Romeriopsis TaxID=2992131 RepID=A0A928VM46_9CYAN|nr:CHASE2 domain-containing protein [Romeriopsis navalis LEGE 11480]
MPKSINYQYQPGGSLPPDAPTYVLRQADTDLYEHLSQGRYCYVLNSRQMGKSSLRVHTMQRLQADGIICAEIELSGIGSQQITAQQWYGGIIQELISGFGLAINRRSWLKDYDDLSPIQRLSYFIESVLLEQVQQPIVVFIDEIDSVLGLEFSTDDFFALLRNCYEKRAAKPEYQRLSFVLLGVATPSDLIQDERSAPFNIGHAIELQGIQLDESYPLMKGLEAIAANPLALLQRILHWTGGQPFLTQKLCWLTSLHPVQIELGEESATIDQIVQQRLIDNWEGQDEPEHLRTIRDRLLRNSSRSVQLLKLYRQILKHGTIPSSRSAEHLELRLSGLIFKRQGVCHVFNQLYQTIFDRQWVEAAIQLYEPPPKLLPWWKAAIIALITISGFMGLRTTGIFWSAELQLFDQMMRLRPDEGADSRLLIVEITAADVQSQSKQERIVSSLSDRSLGQLLKKLDQGNPRAIGLDIYRDYPVASAFPKLTQTLQNHPRLIAICNYADQSQANSTGVAAPPEVRQQYQGFNNVVLDADRVLRRHVLAVGQATPCGNKYAFNLRLAELYLEVEDMRLSFTSQNALQFAPKVFAPLEARLGSYQKAQTKGHQIMLNYRSTEQIAQTVTLREVLQADFDVSQLQNKVILIGTTDPSFQDVHWQTPYSASQANLRTMSGVEIQAHMVSQILSHVLDDRHLINQSHIGLEMIFLLSSGAMGGIIAYLIRKPGFLLLIAGGSISLIFGSGLVLLGLQGVWLPIASGMTIFLVTGASVRLAMQFYQKPILPRSI